MGEIVKKCTSETQTAWDLVCLYRKWMCLLLVALKLALKTMRCNYWKFSCFLSIFGIYNAEQWQIDRSVVTSLSFPLKVSITINDICSLGYFSLSFNWLIYGNIIYSKSSIDLFVFYQWLSEKVRLDSAWNCKLGRYLCVSLS